MGENTSLVLKKDLNMNDRMSITEVRISRCKVFNRNDQNFKKVSNKKSPTRRADGGKQIKTDAIFQRVRQFMYSSVT